MTSPTDLPAWNLDDLYPGVESQALRDDIENAVKRAETFRKSYADRVPSLDGAALARAIGEYEAVEEILGRLLSYAYLVYATAINDAEIGRFYQTIEERVNDISTEMLFFALELNRIEDDEIEAKLADPGLAHYRPWIEYRRAFRPHQLSDEVERLLHEKAVAGRNAWTRLFDEHWAQFRFTVDGDEMNGDEVLNLMSHKDARLRKQAAKTFAKTLSDNIQTFALVTNTLIKDKEIEDRWRGYARPVSARNLSNQVEDEVVDALIDSVREAYPRLAHRYYRIKARWLGMDKMNYWDRNAALPEDADRDIPWGEAREIILDAYGSFSPTMARLADQFFEKGWIHAPVADGKASGAFSHPTVPSAHPYVLLNYHGKIRDVMTLAHELGHGVHQLLSAEQGALMADTPLTLSETASVFGEQLTFQALLARETDPRQRRVMLANKIEDMMNTVVRQIAFSDFERRLHDRRRQGELTPDEIGRVWMDVQRESLGDAFTFEDEYRHFWAYIPHFVHTPFYVYAYAFGECLVHSLYAVYEADGEGFEAKYLDMLKAGGTLRHRELLRPFGLDAGDRGFWGKGVDLMAGYIDRLEAELS